MGKKNKGNKYDKLGYFGKREADMKMAKKYGIDTSQYGNSGRPGQSNNNKKSYDQLKKDVSRAAANDYDVRRSVELAQEAGNKQAKKLGKGISNAGQAYAATRFMEKTHKKRIGAGGNYDGANDEGNVMNYWKNKVLDQRKAESNSAVKTAPAAAVEAAQEPRLLSDRGKAAIEAGGDYTFQAVDRGLGTEGNSQFNADFKAVDRGLGNESVAYDPNGGIQTAGAGEFLNNYKQDVQAGVKKAGVSTRGAGSIQNRF